MHPIKVLNPKMRANKDIACNVVWDFDSSVELPFTASPNDIEPHGRMLYEDLMKGKYGNIAPYTDKDVAKENAISNSFYLERQIGLSDSIIRTFSEEKEAGIISDTDFERWKQWISYRKKLRELELTSNDIDWPDQPQ